MDNHISDCYWRTWKKAFVYQGEATRSEFWSFILINLCLVAFIALVSYFVVVVIPADRTSRGGLMFAWNILFFIPLRKYSALILILPLVSLGIRRMHDIGKNGWWFGLPVLFGLVIIPWFTQIMLHHQISSLVFHALYYANKVINPLLLLFVFWLCIQRTRQIEP